MEVGREGLREGGERKRERKRERERERERERRLYVFSFYLGRKIKVR